MVPADEESFTVLLETGLRAQDPATTECNLVARDERDPIRLAGYIALSCDHSPRKPPFNWDYVAAAVRRLGPRAASGVLCHQFRLMGLLCAPLGPKTAQLHSLIVDPDRRGQGIAADLVRRVEDKARRQGQEIILLYILDGNPVEEFYRQFGYRRVPLPRPTHPLPDPGIAMRRVLDE